MLTSAARRRVFGDYQGTQPSRFLDEIPPSSRARGVAAYSSPRAGARGGWGYAPNPYGRDSRAARRAPSDARTPEDEDQSGRGGLRAGGKVRHGQFGVGTWCRVEELDDDLKLVVRFGRWAQKTLRAKYAKLELA